MNGTKYFLGKNEQNIENNKKNGNDKLPYFSLFVVPAKKGDDWIQIGAAWKSSSGKGYNLKFSPGVKVDVEGIQKFNKSITQD